jgi:hypothetical protein
MVFLVAQVAVVEHGIVVTARVVLELLAKVMLVALEILAILGVAVAVAVLEPWAQTHLMGLGEQEA